MNRQQVSREERFRRNRDSLRRLKGRWKIHLVTPDGWQTIELTVALTNVTFDGIPGAPKTLPNARLCISTKVSQ